MEITILGTESLGARGLASLVETEDRTIVIDPGVALGLMRKGLPPHPAETAAADRVRGALVSALSRATDVVISHFHGDHLPLTHPSPYQFGLEELPPLDDAAFWCKGPDGISATSLHRRRALEEFLGHPLPGAEGRVDDTIHCSHGVFHGSTAQHLGKVMMTRIEEDGEVFIHASDIQLLSEDAVATIFGWQPTVLFVSGPPLYLSQLSWEDRRTAWTNALVLAGCVETFILDHHLLRALPGYAWLRRLRRRTSRHVICAAEYMQRQPLLLEARRKELYDMMPVPSGWHEAYARGEAGYEEYDIFP